MNRREFQSMSRDFNLFRKDRGISGVAMHDFQKTISADYINPMIIEERSMNITQIDVFSRLLMDNIIFLGASIDGTVGNIITAQLLFLQSINPDKKIELYLSTPGGSIDAGLSIMDTIDFIKNPVNTISMSCVASMGFMIALSGERRGALKNCRLMSHQPLSSTGYAQATDILITATEIQKMKDKLFTIIHEKTGIPLEDVYSKNERDNWYSASEAKDAGIIHYIVGE